MGNPRHVCSGNCRYNPLEFRTRSTFGGVDKGRALTVGQPEITKLLHAIASGEPAAQQELFERIYDELRAIAAAQMSAERSAHTLAPTALVNEAYLRLAGTLEQGAIHNRAHFFGAAAEAMRRVLVDTARARGAQKRGGDRVRELLTDLPAAAEADPQNFLAVDAALEALNAFDAELYQIVRLRFFAGQSLEQTAHTLGVSERTIKRRWRFARAWLVRRIEHAEPQ